MITAITFQWKYNEKYLNKKEITHPRYGLHDTIQLEKELKEDIDKLQNVVLKIVSDLNADLDNTNVQEIVMRHAKRAAMVTNRTKKYRTYYIHGLTIHEEDK